MPDWRHLPLEACAQVVAECDRLALPCVERASGRGGEVLVDWPDGRAWVGNAASLAAFRARAGRLRARRERDAGEGREGGEG